MTFFKISIFFFFFLIKVKIVTVLFGHVYYCQKIVICWRLESRQILVFTKALRPLTMIYDQSVAKYKDYQVLQPIELVSIVSLVSLWISKMGAEA